MRISNDVLGLLPNVATRPSGSRIADEWYRRPTVGDATLLQVFVFGLKICALYTGAPLNSTLLVPPPVSNTVESGSTTALTYILAMSIGGPAVNTGFAGLRSAIAVDAVASTFTDCQPPPITITRWSCAGGRSTLAPWSRRLASV